MPTISNLDFIKWSTWTSKAVILSTNFSLFKEPWRQAPQLSSSPPNPILLCAPVGPSAPLFPAGVVWSNRVGFMSLESTSLLMSEWVLSCAKKLTWLAGGSLTWNWSYWWLLCNCKSLLSNYHPTTNSTCKQRWRADVEPAAEVVCSAS